MAGPARAQNIYDDKRFFEGYIQLPRQVQGLDGSPEWPEFRAMIPDIKGAKVLDLGCGFGWLCRWAREGGAEQVLGIDVSSNMLAKAQTFPKDSAIRYLQADLETVEFQPVTYDVVISSLALHYLKNLSALISQIFERLKPGGTFVFCVEHPIFTAPRNPDFIEHADGSVSWPVNQYLLEGSRSTNWFADGVLKQHRTIATYISMLLDAGFILSALNEWGPNPQQVAEFPDWQKSRERPMFLIVKATRPCA
ncbi:SIS-domain containing [Hyphodiscus hymeniophilus]|uniref:SIS-domain containing n=1 Tax=Hyphodiscus hymeniophilus TaxID=353542 RepID=A0A9P6VPG5_9HELO|nr:SIS-domain containing [Hyphodiscus hymeniophilus]